MPPREKLLKLGISSLEDKELVALLIGSGVEGTDYSSVSDKVISLLKKSGLRKSLDVKGLVTIRGIGDVNASRIVAAIELGKRLGGIATTKELIKDSESARHHFRDISNLRRESVKAIYLNARFEVIESEVVGVGSIDAVHILPRDVISPALKHGAVYIILGHNHPSGDVTPSQPDVELTNRIAAVCKLIGLKLLDHIIVAKGGKWSTVKT